MTQKLESIDKIYGYLLILYEETKMGYVKSKKITKSDVRGLSFTNLKKFGVLKQFKNTYTWGGLKCNYALAYNVYQDMRGNKSKYADLVEGLKHPETQEVNEFVFALNVKTKNLKSNDVGFKENNVCSETVELCVNRKPFDVEVVEDQLVEISPETNDSNQGLLDMITSLQETNKSQEKEMFVIRELLHELVDSMIKNIETTKNSQRSISTTIAILKTNQDNLMTLSGAALQFMKEQYSELREEIKVLDEVSPEMERKLEALGLATKYLRTQVDKNVEIVNKYGYR